MTSLAAEAALKAFNIDRNDFHRPIPAGYVTGQRQLYQTAETLTHPRHSPR
jgi:hypothetical protein